VLGGAPFQATHFWRPGKRGGFDGQYLLSVGPLIVPPSHTACHMETRQSHLSFQTAHRVYPRPGSVASAFTGLWDNSLSKGDPHPDVCPQVRHLGWHADGLHGSFGQLDIQMWHMPFSMLVIPLKGGCLLVSQYEWLKALLCPTCRAPAFRWIFNQLCITSVMV